MNISDFITARLDEEERQGKYGAPTEVVERLLRDIAFKRAVVRLYDQWPTLVERPTSEAVQEGVTLHNYLFHVSREIEWLTTREYVKRFGSEPPVHEHMRALAAIWSDHPDYDKEAWA